MTDKMETYQRKESGCIDPCPLFACVLDKAICDTNCHRTLTNPCRICKENHDGICSHSDERLKTKRVLLRPDTIAYINKQNAEDMGFITKDVGQTYRYKYAEKLNDLEDEESALVENIQASKLPTFINKYLYRKKIASIKQRKAELHGAIKGYNDLFGFIKDGDDNED